MLRTRLSKARDSLNVVKPTIFILGPSGVGKSSLINKIYGETLCKTGVGVPVTQNFIRLSKDGVPILLYDSKGLERGVEAGLVYFESLTSLVQELMRKDEAAQNVHLAWYVCNGPRFESADRAVIESLKRADQKTQIPVIVLINKSDENPGEALEMQRVIEGMEIPNVHAVIRTTTKVKYQEGPFSCRMCNSHKISLELYEDPPRTCCKDCGWSETLTSIPSNLDMVISESLKLLPDSLKANFVASQNVFIRENENRLLQESRSWS